MAGLNLGIAGAGLLGRLLAWRLAREDHRVTVFDPAPHAGARGAAGWTAAGMLSPVAELECANAQTAQRGLRSIELWSQVVPCLPQPVDFRRAGSLLVAHRSDLGAAQRVLDVFSAQSPADAAPPRRLSTQQLHELEPAVLGPAAAWLLPQEAQIHTVQAMDALADAATQLGVAWRWGEAVRRVEPHRLDGHTFDRVFDVRGLGARPDLPLRGEGHGFTPQLRGVRGEILWVHAPGLVLRRPLRLLHPRLRVYLVPRPGDIVLVGASEIESEDRSPISVRTLLNLLSAAHSVLPELAEGRVVHTEVNLRPALPDNLPAIETQAGLTRINGLFRHGWLLAPALVEEALHDAGLGAGLWKESA
jgi:glycine oxidase